MKIIILSTILLFCILPVANANNGNVKIKFIRESVTSSNMSRSISEQNLSGVGFENLGIGQSPCRRAAPFVLKTAPNWRRAIAKCTTA